MHQSLSLYGWLEILQIFFFFFSGLDHQLFKIPQLPKFIINAIVTSHESSASSFPASQPTKNTEKKKIEDLGKETNGPMSPNAITSLSRPFNSHPRNLSSVKQFWAFSLSRSIEPTNFPLFSCGPLSFGLEFQISEFGNPVMDKCGEVLDAWNPVPVSSTSDSALELQGSIHPDPESTLMESLIKKNTVKDQNSIAEHGLCMILR